MKASNEFSCAALVGFVSEYNPEFHTARVFFPDRNFTSSWLPVLLPVTNLNRTEAHLDTNEHVLCLLLGNGLEIGFVIGSFYDETNKPNIADQNITALLFNDKTSLTYDRDNHNLLFDVKGDIEIKASGNISLKAERIDLN